jgi:putative transposase
MSNSRKIYNPQCLKRSQGVLEKHQRCLEQLNKDTTKYKSKREQITKLHSKIRRQRKDFLDKLSHKLINDSQVDSIFIEVLSIKSMLSINFSCVNMILIDNGWNMFANMLKYKSDWTGKNLIKIGRFEPSSKTCSKCGNVNHDLKRCDYEWTCISCKTKHDRDENASKNILDFAIPKMEFKGRNDPIETHILMR